MKQILLSGGGGPIHTKKLDALFASLISPILPVLVIKIIDENSDLNIQPRLNSLKAFGEVLRKKLRRPKLTLAGFRSALAVVKTIISPRWAEESRYRKSFSSVGIKEFTLWTNLRNKNKNDLKLYGGIYIDGGNTFEIQKSLQESGFDKEIIRFANRGGIVYGKCAGANVLGYDTLSSQLYNDDYVEVHDKLGLRLFRDYSIFSNYSNFAKDKLSRISKSANKPVLALEPKTCLYLRGSKVSIVGKGRVYEFNPTMRQLPKEFEIANRSSV